MKVLLINPHNEKNRDYTVFPLGLLSIATHLKNCGHTVKLLDRTSVCTNISHELRCFTPDIIGISFLTSKAVKDTIKVCEIAKSMSIPVVFGNTLASAMPELLLESGYADYISIGEGEFTWEELLTALENSTSLYNVDGIAFIDNGRIVINKSRSIADASKLPIIDWSFIDPPKYFRSQFGCSKMSYLYSGKGCNGNCAFCFNKSFHHQTYRKRPLENVMNELSFLVNTHGLNGVFFADELWCSTAEEMYETCRTFKESKLDFVWGCQLRIGMFSKADYEYMYECGCRWIFFGIESGSKEMLKRIHKPIKYENIVETLKMCCESGITPLSSFIFGYPDETADNLRDTVELIKQIRPYSIFQTFFFSPYVGTELYDDLKRAGRLTGVKNLKELRTSSWDVFQNNYSSVSIRELKCIRSHVIWWSLTNGDVASEKREHSHAIHTLVNVLKNASQNGLKHMPANLIYSLKEFVSVVFYITCFPKISKKYNLHITCK